MKNARHSKILELIGQHSIDKQEELLAHLRRSGFEVTQATVSRDIRELGLVKVATGDGHYRYVAASGAGKSAHSPSRFETIFRESVLKADSRAILCSSNAIPAWPMPPAKCLTQWCGTMWSARFPATTHSLS